MICHTLDLKLPLSSYCSLSIWSVWGGGGGGVVNMSHDVDRTFPPRARCAISRCGGGKRREGLTAWPRGGCAHSKFRAYQKECACACIKLFGWGSSGGSATLKCCNC